MLKVKSRSELRAMAGEQAASPPPPDPMAGVHQALATLAEQVSRTNAVLAECMSAKPAPPPREMIATVERDGDGLMKKIIIKTRGN